jgi:hypothetical protein
MRAQTPCKYGGRLNLSFSLIRPVATPSARSFYAVGVSAIASLQLSTPAPTTDLNEAAVSLCTWILLTKSVVNSSLDFCTDPGMLFLLKGQKTDHRPV